MRVLITGGTGFVGRQIMRALDVEGLEIIPIIRTDNDDLLSSVKRVGEIIKTPCLFSEHENWWEKVCKDIDVVIHAAWYTEPGNYLQSPLNMDCLIGSLNLARGAVKAGVKRFVGIGTCAEYDLNHGVVSVDTALNPLTTYAASKAALYLALSQWLPSLSVSFSWCRLFYLYGEGENKRRLVSYIRRQLMKGEAAELTSGKQIRDFMNVVDAGKKIAQVALSDQYGPLNISSGVPITVRQLAERIADEYGRRDLLKFNARPDNLFDPPCVVGVPNY